MKNEMQQIHKLARITAISAGFYHRATYHAQDANDIRYFDRMADLHTRFHEGVVKTGLLRNHFEEMDMFSSQLELIYVKLIEMIGRGDESWHIYLGYVEQKIIDVMNRMSESIESLDILQLALNYYPLIKQNSEYQARFQPSAA